MKTLESSSNRRVLITGGAGFIGCHLVDALTACNTETVVLDNLTSGSLENITTFLKNPNFKFWHEDLLNAKIIKEKINNCSVVFHLAADPDVKKSSDMPNVIFKQNVVATYNLLEAIRLSESVEKIVFTSSSTVYGEASVIPTPENYGPLEPISIYGASKLASEALVSAYASTYGFEAVVFRLANVIGSRSHHGVIFDFINKLRINSHDLEILGDGTQSKSYLHIEDCIEGLILGAWKSSRALEIYNLGSDDQVDVKSIANIVVEEMALDEISFIYKGGVDGGRGWTGDVKHMLLDCRKLKSHGWSPKMSSLEAVRKTVRSLLQEI